jgi:hypothetical protein
MAHESVKQEFSLFSLSRRRSLWYHINVRTCVPPIKTTRPHDHGPDDGNRDGSRNVGDF